MTNKPCILKPLGARVVVEHDYFRYEGRLIIPDNAKRQPTTGIIVAVGQTTDGKFSVGDRVIFAQFSGTLIQIAGKPAYRILSEDEVLAKITTDEILEYTAA